MSTREEPGPFDGLERAKPGEPVFTLQGGDPLASPLVMLWASLARIRAIGGEADAGLWTRILRNIKREEREEKCADLMLRAKEAEEIAWNMEEWRNGAPVAVAEQPVSSYSGHTSEPEAIEAKRRFDAIKGAAAVMHNAVAEVTDAASLLEEFGYPEIRAEISEVVERLKALAAEVQPKRTSYAHRAAPEEIGR